MISLRYHIVTIVAVFLALALGLLGGGTFVQPALQRELERRTDAYQGTIDRLREEIDEREARAGGMEAFADAALPYLTRDRLLGTRVVVMTHDGVEGTVLAEAQGALIDAGAEIVAVLTTRDAIAATDAETQAQLRTILGMPTGATVGPQDVADALAARLASGREPLEDPETDVLDGLLSAGFVTTSDAAAVSEIGGAGHVVVVLGGGTTEEPVLDPDAFGGTLVEGLADRGLSVAAGEGSATPLAASFVDVVRERLGTSVVTVDDLDLSVGGAALVLGIDLLQRTGQGGAYGIRDGAEPLPPLA
ncbi:MAG TPA: copper transporter [Actinomycetota bacterium]|nr:copper transporter [Actinomycetota bacterium]